MGTLVTKLEPPHLGATRLPDLLLELCCVEEREKVELL